MVKRGGGVRTTMAFGAVAVAIAVAAVAYPALAGSGSVSGKGVLRMVTGPECTSPDGFCLEGELSGGVKGAYRLTATDVIATADTPTSGVVIVVGDVRISTRDGDLLCKTTMAFQNTGDHAISDLCAIVAGTGSYLGASGHLQTIGALATGDVAYEGLVRTP